MKYLVILLLVFSYNSPISAQTNSDTLKFEREKDLFEYAFQNTDLINNTPGLFLDYYEYPDSIEQLLNLYKSNPTKSEMGYQIATILNKIDVTGYFEPKTLIYPFYDHLHSLDYERKQKIPLMVFDTEISKLNSTSRNIVENWTTNTPLSSFSGNDFESFNYFFATPFMDSIVYDNVVLHFDSSKIRSNRARELSNIVISVNGIDYTLNPNDELDLSQFTGQNQFTFNYHFDDGSFETITQNISIASKGALPKSGLADLVLLEAGELTIDGDYSNITIDNPSIKYYISDGCNDGLLKKPFFLIAGWGPHTDISNINEMLDWPSTVGDFIVQSNQEGFVENLNNAGYDIVFVKFFPPNASIDLNSALLELMINHVNTRKMNDGSYEENIIQGYSAGALCAKYTLQRMEKKHLEQNAPHPHTKLFISFDGENQGANIPLGVQHMVEYLDEYEHSNNIVWFNNQSMSPGAAMYALKYIVDAPLSRELLHYYYTETGNSVQTAGQGHHSLRTSYLSQQSLDHHSMNNHIPDYPSFCRNISISNGSSTPNIDMSTYMSNHYPYPSETNATIFYQLGWTKKREAKFLTHGIGTPFIYTKKMALFSSTWIVQTEAITQNPLILDNAPGGIIFIESNPLVAINDLMAFELWGSPDISNDHLYSFTPTVLTHDIKNFDAFANGGLGYMNYNFKTQGLNYDNEYDAPPYISNPSNTIGYPHLGYPNNHYSITPFDALFTWNENTVHVTSGRKSQSYYEEEWSPARGLIKNFIVEEGEHWNIMLQNKDIGASTNGNITYRVDYNADHDIWFGEHVTQKTDFKPVTIVDNTIVESMAGNAIYIKNGFHAKPGCEWHAYIGVENCDSFGGKSMVQNHENGNEQSDSGIYSTFTQAKKALLIPNPTSNRLRIKLINTVEREQFNFYIYNFNGILVDKGSAIEEKEINLNLDKGIYIVKIKTLETWYTEKLIIQ